MVHLDYLNVDTAEVNEYECSFCIIYIIHTHSSRNNPFATNVAGPCADSTLATIGSLLIIYSSDWAKRVQDGERASTMLPWPS